MQMSMEATRSLSERTLKSLFYGNPDADLPRGARFKPNSTENYANRSEFSQTILFSDRLLERFVYLTFLFERLPNINTRDLSELDKLLPWDVTAQSNFRPPTETNL